MITENDILERVEVDKGTKCAHWVGSFSKKKPILYKDGKRYWVRSEVWNMRKGPKRRGFYVAMRCENYDCVNSRHMELRSNLRPAIDRDSGL